MTENPRTTSARDHDDSDLIDDAEILPDAMGRSGGNLPRDVATKDEMKRDVADPDAHTRVTKQDDIDNDQAAPNQRAR